MSDPDVSTKQPPASPEQFVTDVDLSPPRGNPFPIVGIGASAGGLEAFGQLLAALPLDSGMAFVLVQHLDPRHESFLPELLSSHTQMPVFAVDDGLKVEPNHVYVIPPNTSMELQDGTLRLVLREPGLHLPIDIFFRSLAAVQGSRAVGVVLSGNASDGSIGVRAIKAECGITFAQSEESARFGGMPRSAIATGAIDYVLEPAAIAKELGVMASHPFLIPSRPGDARSETLPQGKDGDMRRIFAQLYGVTKVDFSRYKPNTIRRRIGRRMMMLRLNSISEYASYIEEHPAELRELYRDLLISVTSFFRDPDSFDALCKLFGERLADRQNKEPLRIWVPGCATGEEVYSLAICLFEVLQESHLMLPVQLFGTDISDIALDRARRGNFPIAIEDSVPPERLARYFAKIDAGYQINKTIREACIFARHDVTRDPPFSNLDLISCRNLLIYLDQAAQRHVLPVFHYALRPTGLLMLGSAETTAAASDLFIPVNQQHKIYMRKAVPARLPIEMGMPGPLMDNALTGQGSVSTALELQKRLERVIQNKYSPDAVLINGEFQILQFRGHTSSYLDPSPGYASLNALRMAAEGLVLPLRRAVQAAKETAGLARENDVEIEIAGQRERITLEVTPIPGVEAAEQYFLVVFVRQTPFAAPVSEDSSFASLPGDEQLATLQRELRETRDYLRDLSEQYEAHSEELRAANEEARSTNEELQSTNEELRTAKEELQSANEELTTVNDELQSRNHELNDTNSDLKNLLSAVTVPILMVDSEVRVRRFNSAAGKLLELEPLDVGRPVGRIRGPIEAPHLEQQIKSVIETLNAASEEVRDSAGCWYTLNIRPYRTIDDRIAGAVITLQDIDVLKRGLQASEEARNYAEGVIETVREPLVVLDTDLRVQRATTAFYQAFLVTPEEAQGRFFYDLGNGQWNHAPLRELIDRALFRSEPFYDFELIHDFPHIGPKTMRLNGRRISFPHSQERMLLLSIEDVTEQKKIAQIRHRHLFENPDDSTLLIDQETETVQDVNQFFLELTGYSREDVVGKTIAEVSSRLGLPELTTGVTLASRSELVRFENLALQTHDGNTVLVDVIGNSYRVGTQPVVQFNIRDLSLRSRALEALHRSEQRFRFFVESVHDYALFQLDCDGVIIFWNAGAERLLGWKEQEAIGKPGSIVFTPEDIENGAHRAELETARNCGRAEDERWHIRKDGTRFFASGVLTQVCDEHGELLGFAKVMRDVTARKEHEEQLRRSLSAKDTLVREIHHRVKNNLQVIVSLLSMQSRHTKDAQVLSAFNDAESRLRAIAQIHERLYASDDLTEVEFAEYLTGLAKELVQLHAAGPDHIQLELDIADMVLHIERAIPLGLIANELILNSLKHGLKGMPGRLHVSLAYLPDTIERETGQTLDAGWAQLRVTDSGPGLPPGVNVAGAQSMGLRLINLLVLQLRGRLEVTNTPGVSATISFPIESIKEQLGSPSR